MIATTTLRLLNDREITLPELNYEQAIDISKIPPEFNEKRISAMIAHLSGDAKLAASLTVQERYFILLNHHAITESEFIGQVGQGYLKDYTKNTIEREIPATTAVGELVVSHLYGAHACVIESLAENVADWVAAQMACQISGNVAYFTGGEAMIWEPVTPFMSDTEINEKIQERFAFISSLSVSKFNNLANVFNMALIDLEHFLNIGFDNDGITIVPQGGAGDNSPARFCALECLHGVIERLSECVAGRRFHNDGTRENELAGSA